MNDDEDAVVRTVLDYFEGWFEGDAARMKRALHPELAKRGVEKGAAGAQTLEETSAEGMIEATARGVGKRHDDHRIEVEVEDVYDTVANVTVRGAVYREYVHLARTEDGWKIVNTLWQFT
jgi:ketosteroid isomerase-like protein